MLEQINSTNSKLSTVKVPKSIVNDTGNIYALPFKSVGCPWLPDNAVTILVDSEVELECYDLVVTFYKGNTKTYFINKLAMNICERRLWGTPSKKSNFGAMAVFESHDDPEAMTTIDTAEFKYLHKIVAYIDGEGLTHKVTNYRQQAEIETLND